MSDDKIEKDVLDIAVQSVIHNKSLETELLTLLAGDYDQVRDLFEILAESDDRLRWHDLTKDQKDFFRGYAVTFFRLGQAYNRKE